MTTNLYHYSCPNCGRRVERLIEDWYEGCVYCTCDEEMDRGELIGRIEGSKVNWCVCDKDVKVPQKYPVDIYVEEFRGKLIQERRKVDRGRKNLCGDCSHFVYLSAWWAYGCEIEDRNSERGKECPHFIRRCDFYTNDEPTIGMN